MRESSTFQAILEEKREEGEINGTRKSIQRIGAKRFGQPSTDVTAQLEAIETLLELEALEDRLLATESWDELLAPLKQ